MGEAGVGRARPAHPSLGSVTPFCLLTRASWRLEPRGTPPRVSQTFREAWKVVFSGTGWSLWRPQVTLGDEPRPGLGAKSPQHSAPWTFLVLPFGLSHWEIWGYRTPGLWKSSKKEMGTGRKGGTLVPQVWSDKGPAAPKQCDPEPSLVGGSQASARWAGCCSLAEKAMGSLPAGQEPGALCLS